MNDSSIEGAHRRLLEEINRNALETENYTGRRRFGDAVMAALSAVPRHDFLPQSHQKVAYSNRPQSIGFGQTISQPYIVAVMTDLLDLKPTDKILEIGTGSGYQAAILAKIAKQVFSIETVKSLAESATRRLREQGYDNVQVRYGDGYKGWKEEAPFDAIIVTAAPERIPETLCQQLKVGGRIIVPVGRQFSTQILKLGAKKNDGRVSFRSTLPVAFVPMVKGPKEEH